jgi:hypothetical protein
MNPVGSLGTLDWACADPVERPDSCQLHGCRCMHCGGRMRSPAVRMATECCSQGAPLLAVALLAPCPRT